MSTSSLSVMAWNVLVASWMLRTGEPTFLHVLFHDWGIRGGGLGPPHGLLWYEGASCAAGGFGCAAWHFQTILNNFSYHNDNGSICKHVGTGKLGLIGYDSL